tara:strand:+ start:3452 stop:3754 length:303 start_codon:yes stop_codon:yes gene_type:complete
MTHTDLRYPVTAWILVRDQGMWKYEDRAIYGMTVESDDVLNEHSEFAEYGAYQPTSAVLVHGVGPRRYTLMWLQVGRQAFLTETGANAAARWRNKKEREE